MTEDRQTEVEIERWLAGEDPPRSADWVAAFVMDELADTPQDRGWFPRPRWVRYAAIALVAVAGIAVGSLWLQGRVGTTGSSPSPSPSNTSISTPSAHATPFLPPEVTNVYTFAEDTWAVVPGDRVVWVQVGEVGMARVDVTTGEVSDAIEDLPAAARRGDSVWSPALGSGLVEFDAFTGEELTRYPGFVGYYIALDESSAWVTDVGHTLDRIDLATGQRLASIDVPAEPKEVAVGFGAVWVACDAGGVVARVDQNTYDVVAEIPGGTRPANLAVGEGAVWVWNHDHRLLRIDPATNEVVATISGMADGPSAGLAVGGGFVWAAVPNGIAKIDPATNAIVDTIELGSGVYVDIEWFNGDLWVSTEVRDQLLRIHPQL